MKLENTFGIPVPADDAWRVLLDVERIAPCVPGASLTSKDAKGYHGKLRVKLGPIGLTYHGVLKILSQDEAAKVVVLEGSGRETRGSGTAKAVITCRLQESGDMTEVFVQTDLAITGKPAQFGRGALAEVAGALTGQFATNLAGELAASDAAPERQEDNDGVDIGSPSAAVRDNGSPSLAAPPATAETAAPIDLLDTAGIAGLKRFGRPAAVAILLMILVRHRRRRLNTTK